MLTIKRLLIWWLVGICLSWQPCRAKVESLGVCSKCSIYILDLSSLAKLHGLPTCNLDRLQVDPENGVVYLKEKGPANKVEHSAGTHSAPWYLYKAIQNSDCEADDMESADLVYVYDYCYYLWWLAHVHSLGRDGQATPGDYLIQGWTAMTQLPRWKKNGGRDFVLFDSHPGFASGDAAKTFNGMLCNEFRHAIHLVVERGQRNVCQSYLEINKMIITPYVPNVIDNSDPLDTFMRPSVPRSKRDITVFFSGKCMPYRGKNVGKKMRYAVVKALQDAGSDTDVQCTENESGHIHQEFSVMLDKMERSVFCLVVPGDAQSTRRLSEIFMAGCIPVYLGPPYNSMPLAEDVSYKSLGVFFNITTYHSWLPTQMQWHIGSERAKFSEEARWWIPDADVYEQMITVDSLADIMVHLRGMPDIEINRKLKEMQSQRLRFTYQGGQVETNAVHSMITQMCTLGGAQGKSRKARTSNIVHQENQISWNASEGVLAKPEKQSGKLILDDFLNGLAHKEDSRTPEADLKSSKGAASKTGHAFLTAQRQNANGLLSEIAGAIRLSGDSWQPFQIEESQKPATSSRQ